MGVLEQRRGEPVRMDGLKVIARVALIVLFLQQENPHKMCFCMILGKHWI